MDKWFYIWKKEDVYQTQMVSDYLYKFQSIKISFSFIIVSDKSIVKVISWFLLK